MYYVIISLISMMIGYVLFRMRQDLLINVLSMLNSHFGTNLTTKESDAVKKKTIGNNFLRNLISDHYDKLLEKTHNTMPFKDITGETIGSLTRDTTGETIGSLARDTTGETIGSLARDTIRSFTAINSIQYEDLTKQKFIELTENFRRPLVIRGFLKHTQACREWNLDFFSDNYGDTVLPTIVNANITNHKNYIASPNGEQYDYVTIREFIQSLKTGGKMYINNISRIFGYHPELLDYLELENIEKYTGIDMKNEMHITQLFFGGNKTGTSLHCSITGNFFYNVKGRKHWYLIDPKYSKYLKPLLSRTGLFAVSQLDICNANSTDAVLAIPRLEVVLSEGDLLFNPPWYWHAISNESEYTIACANRFTNFFVGFKNNFLYSLLFFSHPFLNYTNFGNFKTREESNIKFDKALLSDILKKTDQVQ